MTRTGCSGDGGDTLHTGWNNICWTNQFSALFPWSKFSWIDTDTNEMCTKQETHDLPDRFYLFIDRITWNYVNLEQKPWILALPTGGPEITEILRKQLDYWYGLKLLEHRHMHTHTYTEMLSYWKNDKNYTFWTFRTFLPVYISISKSWNCMQKAPKLTFSEARPLPSGSYWEEAPGVHHKRRPLDLTEMTQNKQYEY